MTNASGRRDEAESAPFAEAIGTLLESGMAATQKHSLATVAFKVFGMDCAEEIATLRKELEPLPGVDALGFDLLNGKMTVTYAPQEISTPALLEAVKRVGLRAEVFGEVGASDEGSWWDRWSRTVLPAASGALLACGFAVHAASVGMRGAISGHEVPFLVKALYASATVVGVWTVLPKAWLALRRLRPDMNLLMVVAVCGAAAIGEWFEAGTVSFLFAASLALESWSVSRARRAVAALMELAPTQARVLGNDGNEELVDAADVKVGTRIIIKPGDKVPLDGRVVSGQTQVNQAPITGESMPVGKSLGDEVFAGTINQEGAIEVETVKPAAQSTLSQIIKMVSEAQSKRSPSEQWVEKFARFYTPAVMALAVVIALVPPLWNGNWMHWLYQALVLLVIACPCALVISTPVSIIAALVAAAKAGILIKGGVYVELPARLRAVALDKTGTLTEGRPAVHSIVPLAGHTERELLEIAVAIEMRSEHPIAQAIVRHGAAQNIRPSPVENYQAVKGKGATATLEGRPVWIGSHRFLEEQGGETPELHKQIDELAATGKTIVVVGEKVGAQAHICGFIALADRIREQSKAAVAQMKTLGIEHIVMLTGDNEPTARAIRQSSGVDDYRAELLPADKVTAIEEMVSRYGTVAMVGDGINDAPALARSSLGIAMGVAGTDAALETADIALMQDDLGRLPWLIEHSRRTLRIIRQNIIAALGVKALFVLLTFLGHASLWTAIAADTGMSLLVVFNSLRLLRGHESKG